MRLETFDTTRRFRAWLMTIAANYCTDVIRRRMSLKRFIQHIPLDVVDFQISGEEGNPEQVTHQREQRERVRQAVLQLPPKYREVLVLFYWNDLSYSEMQEVTGLNESTIKTRLHRARQKLTSLLSSNGDREER
jgi:RNA polymerase sigma-70 factor (ECF subfamily)